MNATLFLQGLAATLGVMGAAVVSGYALRQRSAIGASFLGATVGMAAAWGLCVLLVRWWPSLQTVPWLGATRHWFAAAVPVAWYSLVISLVSMGQRPSSSTLARLIVIPVLTSLLAAGGGQHGLLWGAEGAPGPWLWVHVGYSLGLVAAGGGALLRDGQAIRAWRRGAQWALIGAGVVAGLVSVMGPWELGGWPWALVLLAVAGCGALLLQMLYLQPAKELAALSAQALGGQANDAVLALDARNRVMDANAPALLLLAEYGIWQAVGRPARQVLTGPLAALASTGPGGAVMVPLGDGSRMIRSRELPLGSGPMSGRALLLHEVCGGASGPCAEAIEQEQAS